MNFYVYHTFSKSMCFILSHNLQDRIIDEKSNTISGYYKNVPIKFIFTENFVEDKSSYHILFRHYAVKRNSIFKELLEHNTELRLPDAFSHEYKILLNKLDFNYKWILFWNFGENMFIHLGEANIENSNEISMLKELSEKTIFFTDNLIKDTFNLEKDNFKTCFTNDLYYWNSWIGLSITYDYSNIHKRLSFPYKIGVSFRSKRRRRIEMLEKIKEINSSDIFINNVSTDSIDLENYWDLMGTGEVSFGLDYYFKYLHKARVHILDETHSNAFSKKLPYNLTEKTYLFLVGAIPFIPTNVYILDCIEKHIGGSKYPFYDDINLFDESVTPFISFIEKFLNNYDSMYSFLEKWTDEIHNIAMNRIKKENSFLDYLVSNEIN